MIIVNPWLSCFLFFYIFFFIVQTGAFFWCTQQWEQLNHPGHMRSERNACVSTYNERNQQGLCGPLMMINKHNSFTMAPWACFPRRRLLLTHVLGSFWRRGSVKMRDEGFDVAQKAQIKLQIVGWLRGDWYVVLNERNILCGSDETVIAVFSLVLWRTINWSSMIQCYCDNNVLI